MLSTAVAARDDRDVAVVIATHSVTVAVVAPASPTGILPASHTALAVVAASASCIVLAVVATFAPRTVFAASAREFVHVLS